MKFLWYSMMAIVKFRRKYVNMLLKTQMIWSSPMQYGVAIYVLVIFCLLPICFFWSFLLQISVFRENRSLISYAY